MCLDGGIAAAVVVRDGGGGGGDGLTIGVGNATTGRMDLGVEGAMEDGGS